MKRAALHNLGCKVNAYETDAMQQMLEAAGYKIVPFEEKADVYIINTCSVTQMADKKSRQMLHRARRQNPRAVVVAAGCYVQTAFDAAKNDDAIDIMIGNNQKHRLVELLEAFAQKERSMGAQTVSREDVNSVWQPYEPLEIKRTGEHTRAFVKVQDGCNQFCSYCIIPYARGRVRSRSISEVTKEARRLAASGCRELVLTGIHLSSYGQKEAYNLHPGDGRPLLSLIEAVHQVPGICRIRLGSLEPRIVTKEFARNLAAFPKVCPHFHLSLQSGCNDTLLRMNRHYTTKDYEKSCALLREAYPNPAITTDVIVGFPGESEQEFLQTRAFVEKMRFYEMHIFKYSRRQNTKAATMPGQVPEEIKAKRSEELIALGRQMSEAYKKSCRGNRVEALLETPWQREGETYYTGYTKEYLPVAVKSRENLSNQIVSGILGEQIQQFFTFSSDYIRIEDN